MRKRTHRRSFDQPGHAHELTFSCFRNLELLGSDRTCEWLADSIENARRDLGFQLWAYVFMPTHVHLIVFPTRPQTTVAALLKRIKQPASRRALAFLRSESSDWLPCLTAQRGERMETHFWQRGGGYDRNVTEPATLERMIDYLHLNPVRKTLAEKATDWKWSSGGWFEGEAPNQLKPDPIPPEWTVGMTKD